MEDGFRVNPYLLLWNQCIEICLNPCSCGRWLQSANVFGNRATSGLVLILVLVEDGFRERYGDEKSEESGLNPCSCGRWLQSVRDTYNRAWAVLILVLVEDGFRVDKLMDCILFI